MPLVLPKAHFGDILVYSENRKKSCFLEQDFQKISCFQRKEKFSKYIQKQLILP